jgi:hypothetical protein
VPNDMLRKAIVLPKDVESSVQKYPRDGDMLEGNYYLSDEYLERKSKMEK